MANRLRIFYYSSPILDPRSIRPPTSTCRRHRAARCTALAPSPAALKPNPPPFFDSLPPSRNTVTIVPHFLLPHPLPPDTNNNLNYEQHTRGLFGSTSVRKQIVPSNIQSKETLREEAGGGGEEAAGGGGFQER